MDLDAKPNIAGFIASLMTDGESVVFREKLEIYGVSS